MAVRRIEVHYCYFSADEYFSARHSGKAFRPVWELPQDGVLSSPFWPVHLPDDAAVKHMCKSLLLTKSVLEVWGEGTSLEAMLASVAAYPKKLKDLYAGADQARMARIV